MNQTKSLEITKYIKQNKKKDQSWNDLADEIFEKFGEKLTKDAVRKRYSKEVQSLSEEVSDSSEFELHNEITGEITLNKSIFFEEGFVKTPENILQKLGYDVDEWDLIEWRIGEWDTSMKDNDGNPIKSVNKTIRAKIKPKIKQEISKEEYVEEIQNILNREITPYKFNFKYNKTLNDNKLLECPGIELHLGKMSWGGDTGQDYDKNIAQERFYHIVEEIIKQQSTERCGNLLLMIGNDFFNSDTVDSTTTKGTPQTNDLRWKKLFGLGLEMNIKFIKSILKKFNNIEVRLQSGNHDVMSSFYLYIALKEHFRETKNIHFSDNYKDVQSYLFGNCAIFFSHGDANLKRLIKSIPAEFYEEWGKTYFRELHLGHLHKEVVVDDESGLITRRVGSPTATDQWHYSERFVGATQKHQTFVWDKNNGLQNIKYINFEPNNKEKARVRK